MPKQRFFAGVHYLGERQIPPTKEEGTFGIMAVQSLVYFCPRCGDIWGRLLVEGAKMTQLSHRPCTHHGDGRLSTPDNGKFPWHESQFAADWPPAAFERELRVWADWHDKMFNEAREA